MQLKTEWMLKRGHNMQFEIGFKKMPAEADLPLRNLGFLQRR